MIVVENDGSKWLSMEETKCENCIHFKKCRIKSLAVFYNNDFITARLLKFCSEWVGL